MRMNMQNINNKTGSNPEMTSRERVLAAFRRQPVDHVPCCPFVNFLLPEQRAGYSYQFPFGNSSLEQVDCFYHKLGSDPIVGIGMSRYYSESNVSTRKWFENNMIHKKWITPSGELYAIVRYDKRWPHGFDIPLYTDFVSHFQKPWLENQADLACLKHILKPLSSKEQWDEFKFAAAQQFSLAEQCGLATIAHIGTGLTGALQLFTPTELCYKVMDDPDLVDEYLELEHRLNMQHIDIMLGLGVDIIRRNGFYETSDFYSPAMLDQFLGRRLADEIKIVHEAGKVIGYTVHTGVTPMIDYLNKLDFDCIMHLDIAHESNNIQRISHGLCGRKSFMTGPSNTFHMWSDDPAVVRKAVQEVFEIFGRTGLLVSACPSSHSIMPWQNTLAMIEEWRNYR